MELAITLLTPICFLLRGTIISVSFKRNTADLIAFVCSRLVPQFIAAFQNYYEFYLRFEQKTPSHILSSTRCWIQDANFDFGFHSLARRARAQLCVYFQFHCAVPFIRMTPSEQTIHFNCTRPPRSRTSTRVA